MTTPTFSATRDLPGFAPFRVIAFEMSAMAIGDTATAVVLKDRQGNIQYFVEDPIILSVMSTATSDQTTLKPVMTAFDGSAGTVTLKCVHGGDASGGSGAATAGVLTVYVLLRDHGYGLGA